MLNLKRQMYSLIGESLEPWGALPSGVRIRDALRPRTWAVLQGRLEEGLRG